MKKALAKAESRVKELETELLTEQEARNELLKTSRKQERKLKELQVSSDEDRKNAERLQDQVTKLTAKQKSMKRQIDEAVRCLHTRDFDVAHTHSTGRGEGEGPGQG